MLATYRKQCIFLGLEFALVTVAVVAAAFLFARLTIAQKEERVIMDLKRIEAAMLAFKENNGGFPSLETLCRKQLNGGDALLDESALIDPWGNPYIFEPGQWDLTIYSQGHPGQGELFFVTIRQW
jgi:Type II secretion system (T2SS), protein G